MSKKSLPVIAIVGNRDFGKALAQRFASGKYYFPILEEPWMSRPDARNEVLKRNNLLAQIRHECVVLAGCNETTIEMLKELVPGRYWEKRVVVIRSHEDMEEALKPVRSYMVTNNASVNDIRTREINSLGGDDQVGVIEESNSLGEVIAETFCSFNGYKIVKIPAASQRDVDTCEDLFRAWNCAPEDSARHLARQQLFELLRSRIGNLEEKHPHRIVFFTRGLPYGVLPFRSPVAHLMQERNLGLQLLRGFLRAQHGIALVLLCDPGELPDTETQRVRRIFANQGVEILDLTGTKATNHRFIYTIQHYPYDLAIISTHAGEVNGRRITEEFINSTGERFEFVYDLFPSFSGRFIDGKMMVQELTVPVSVNGISWYDKRGLEEQAKGFSLREYFSPKREAERKERKPIKTELCEGVKFSNALKMKDFNWIPVMSTVGDNYYPIIFNNACASWMSMGEKFVYAGASAYIGTSKDINTSVAAACGSRFVELAIKRRSMLYALFDAQKEFINQLGYSPYLFWGHPDISLTPNYSDNKRVRLARRRATIMNWRRKLLEDAENRKRDIQSVLECLAE
jgi:hypothetical protein